METSLRVIILILRKCTRNNKLPLDHKASTFTFPLPLTSPSSLQHSSSLEDQEEEMVEGSGRKDSSDAPDVAIGSGDDDSSDDDDIVSNDGKYFCF